MGKSVLNTQVVPKSFVVCFNKDCALHDSCMRQRAVEMLPDGREMGQSVYPAAYRAGKCRFFMRYREVEAAFGFGDLLCDVRRSDYQAMKRELHGIVSTGGTYYRYKNGELPLMPEQQEAIRSLMRRYGYSDEVRFNGYRMVCDFFTCNRS